MDDDNDVDNEDDDEFDDVHDIPLLDKAYAPIYNGSKTNILSAVLLINYWTSYGWSVFR